MIVIASFLILTSKHPKIIIIYGHKIKLTYSKNFIDGKEASIEYVLVFC